MTANGMVVPGAEERFDHERFDQQQLTGAEGQLPADGEAIQRLFVRHGGRIIVVPVDRIEYLEARRDYVAVHAPPNRYLVHLTLSHLEAHLPADRFLRIHRSFVVNLNYVTELHPVGNSQLEVLLTSGAKIVASRSRSRALRSRAA
jgi:two-component system LytT family response regulator